MRAVWFEENLTITGMWIFTAATTLLVAGNALNYLVEHPQSAQACSICGTGLLVVACALYMYAARPLQWWLFRPRYVYVSRLPINGEAVPNACQVRAPHNRNHHQSDALPATIFEIRESKAAVAIELAAAMSNLGLAASNLATVKLAIAGLERTHAQLERLELLESELINNTNTAPLGLKPLA
jgi:hypothetical protein